MADLRITELPLLAGADLDASDPLAVADLSASETKKITAGSLVTEGVSRFLSDGTIPAAKLVNDSITATQLATGAVGTTELADSGVTYAKIQNVSATDRLLGRSTAGAGSVEEITCTAAGRALLDDSSAADQRTTLGLGDLATQSASAVAITGGTATLSSATITSATISGGTVSNITDLAIADGGTGASTAAGARTNLGVAIGTDVQAFDAGLQSISALTTSANQILYTTAADTYATTAITAAGRALIDDADAAAQRTTLGLGALATASTIGAAQLDTDAVTTAKIQDDAVTNAKIAAGAVGATELADVAVTNAKIADTTIAYGKLNLADGSVPGAKLQGNSVTADQIAAGAIGASELADDAVDTAAIQNGAVTDDKVATGISGSKISNNSLNGTALVAGSVTGDKIAAAAVNRGLDITGSAIGHTNTVVAGTANGITFDAQGHITGTSALASTDLPAASTTTPGAVSIPASSGLSVSGTGVVTHTNTVSPGTVSGFTFNSTGHITAAVPLIGGDLPVATGSTVGGVVVPAGALNVDGSGTLTHAASGATPGTYSKVTINSQGHVTAGLSLTASDIPSLDASKITTGTFSSAFLAPNSVTADQLADYGIAQVSETAPTPEFAGQWWINPSDRSAYIWVGTVSPTINGYWLLVGYGSPTQLNLRFGGTYNASTNTVVTLNEYGVEAGLVIGQALGTPNAANNGVYLVVTTAGTGTSPAPAVSLAIGDWVLSQGTGATWTKIAVVSGASGTFNDYDILSDGTYFTPDMPAVSDVRDALALLWGRVQIATTSQIGVVRESSEILVDNSTGEMTVGIVDDGTY